MNLVDKIQKLKPHRALLKNSLIGIEKEGLRISKKGEISQTPHPKAFGCALTHPSITTDFSESLIELITPPMNDAQSALAFLAATSQYVYHHLPKEQNFWPSSMPCVIRGETRIPIAKYGTSNQGKMKTVYRRGLANRYGRAMQTIAGIHFNYSFSPTFLEKYQTLFTINKPLPQFSNEQYIGLTRNVLRYGWIIPYLFGASNAVCKSFLKGYHQHSLTEFNASTLYGKYATSLRMGNIGYQNLREDEVGVKANYNSLGHYINSLKSGMQTSCDEYEKIGLKNLEQYQQLNTNILQIENEYYGSVRPKPVAGNMKPLNALNKNGIDYIELRSLDINPTLPLGIDLTQVFFLEAFMLFCLLQDSPAISSREQFDIDNNDQLVAHKGRKANLKLIYKSKSVELRYFGLDIMDKIFNCTKLLSKQHQQAVRQIQQRFHDPDLTPSAILLKMMKSQNQGFFDYTNALAKQHRKDFLSQPINHSHFALLDKQARISCVEQRKIEQADELDFKDFLAQYFSNE